MLHQLYNSTIPVISDIYEYIYIWVIYMGIPKMSVKAISSNIFHCKNFRHNFVNELLTKIIKNVEHVDQYYILNKKNKSCITIYIKD